MITAATLTSEPIAGRDGARLLTVDCRHGTTTLHIFAPPSDPTAIDRLAADGARLAVLKHFSEEGCRCTLELRRRFGLGVRA